MRRWPVRLAITLIVPIVLYVIGRSVLVPGVDLVLSALMMPRALASAASYGIFALGVLPALSAYGVVELVASLVPRWSRLRHGDPRGRTQLERTSSTDA